MSRSTPPASGVTPSHAADGEAGFAPVPGWHLVMTGGYRYLRLETNEEPDLAKRKNSGPLTGAGLRF